MELTNAVQDVFRIDVPASITFDYPTVLALADYIASEGLASTRHQKVLCVVSSCNKMPSSEQTRQLTSEVIGWASSMASNGNEETSVLC